MAEFIDDTEYPVTASTGGNNAHCVHCSIGYSGSYCVCLHKIAAVGRGMPTSNPDCDTAIRNRVCEAVHMREQELAAGKALFFVDRNKQRAFHDEQAAKALALKPVEKKFGENMPSKLPPRPAGTAHALHEFADDRQRTPKTEAFKPVKPVKPVKPLVPDTGNDYANAINAAISEISKPAPVAPKPAPIVTKPIKAPVTQPAPAKLPEADAGIAALSPLEAARRRMQQKQANPTNQEQQP